MESLTAGFVPARRCGENARRNDGLEGGGALRASAWRGICASPYLVAVTKLPSRWKCTIVYGCTEIR